jgi:hypothetical protein
MGQDIYRLHDFGNTRLRVIDPEPGHVIEEPVEIIENLGNKLDAGQ